MTLNECWENCEAMWKWIAEVWQPSDDVDDLKHEWMVVHGFSNIPDNCFFCDWAEANCFKCPGAKVDPHFDCSRIDHHFRKRPVEFYNEIVRINKIRLGQK